MGVRHFLTLTDITKAESNQLMQRALKLKAMQKNGEVFQPFIGKTMGMIFEKSSTRTRISFEAGMAQFGGHAIFLSPRDTQIGRGEPIEDSARVISSMVDVVMIRTFEHDKLTRFAAHSSVPVINGLTDDYHPCQLLADMMTYIEHRGDIAGKKVAWVGDGNNMCMSYMLAADLFGFELTIAVPKGFEPDAALIEKYTHCVTVTDSPADAIKNAHLVVTDVWASMGQESEQAAREQAFAGFKVTESLLDTADDTVVFMHCLPAHRDEEISDTLLDDSRSVVWDEAENRLHAQKALIEFLLSAPEPC